MLAPKLTPQGWVLKLLKAGTLLDTGAVNAVSIDVKSKVC